MKKIDYIKQNYNIVELAHRFGCSPYGNGNTVNTKFNCLRTEKTSSLKLYRDTNTFHDFGSKLSGDVITFYSEYYQIDIGDTIESMLREIGKTGDDFEAREVKQIHIPDKNYMSPNDVLKSFNSKLQHIDVCPFNHLKDLETISPLYAIQESKENDSIDYFNLLKYSDSEKTIIALLPDEKGVARTFRYRYKKVGDDIKKWVALYGTQSSYLYCRFNENPITLIVEGTRDYLNAILCGYSVIALPSAGYKKLDNELLRDRFCVFIDDDDGKNSMLELYDNAICEKILFNHTLFKNITKCKSKDFSDYLYQFKTLKEFKDTFERFIYTNNEEIKNWKDDLCKCKTILTKESLDNAPDVIQLIDGFIFKGTVTVLHSKPGQGKSTLILALLKKLVTSKKIENFIYFDSDNPMSVLKNRLSKLNDIYGESMIYHSHTLSSTEALREEMRRLCLYKNQGQNTLVVIDTLGKFVKNVNSDDECKPFMDMACELRDNFGATVIIVHHSKKEKDEKGNSDFRGSTVISGDCDFMWGLRRDKDTIHIRNDKGRFEYFEKITAKVNLSNYDIEMDGGYNYEDDIEDSNDEDFKVDIDLIIDFLGSDKKSISEIQKHFLFHKTKDKRDYIWNIIKDNKDLINLEKDGKGWFCECKKVSPQITDFNADDMEIPECLL